MTTLFRLTQSSYQGSEHQSALMAQLVSVSVSNTNSKVRSSNPAGNKKDFRLDNSILTQIEIYLK